MSAHFANWEAETLDLAISRFTVGLDERDQERLEQRADASDLGEFERVVAAIHLGSLRSLEAPPTVVVERLEQAGQDLLGQAELKPKPRLVPKGDAIRPAGQPGGLPGWVTGGLLWAAGMLLMFFLLREPAPADPFAQRASLIARAADLQRIDWTATEDPAAAGAGGDVVWSSELQEGYMRFEGLQPNDPSVAQYQLWIFDKTRADWEAKPVDGGVFDVTESGEVVVPIEPKLAVRESALFAITVEVPGGVVVSEREHLILLASP